MPNPPRRSAAARKAARERASARTVARPAAAATRGRRKAPKVSQSAREKSRVPVAGLRWAVDVHALGFASTSELEPFTGVHAQERALEALRLGADLYAPGYNVFCLSLTGADRLEIAKAALRQVAPRCAPSPDRCYVRNFKDADAPRLLTLPRSTARAFKRDVDDLVEQLVKHLALVFEEERFVSRVREITDAHQRKERELLGKLHELARKGGFAISQVDHEDGPSVDLLYRLQAHQLALPDLEVAVREAREGLAPPFAESPEQAAELVKQLASLDLDRVHAAHAELRVLLERTLTEARRLTRSLQRQVASIEREESLLVVEGVISELAMRGARIPEIVAYLEDMKADVLDHLWLFKKPHRPGEQGGAPGDEDGEGASFAVAGDRMARYRVNVLADNSDKDPCPVVIEATPSRRNLVGSLMRVTDAAGRTVVDHRSIRPGSLLAADGGYLILDASDVASDGDTWRILKRILRHSCLDMREASVDRETSTHAALRPDAIPLNTKVIMVGDEDVYEYLDELDVDFKHVFKIRAEFDWLMDRTTQNVRQLGAHVQGVVVREGLQPFSADAIAELAEHSARLAEQGGKMISRFDLLSDVVRQSDFAAREARAGRVTAKHVRQALTAASRRCSLRAESLREAINERRIIIRVSGWQVGQVNGLAVRSTIEHAFGYPVRITAVISRGSAGVVSIEREVRLSGSLHDKGMFIVQGYLSYRYGADLPLAFNASVAFEQLYGGIEGDSASSAEIFALLSALSGIPLDQGIAVTGSVNQVGEIQPVGAVNEKIEGFFDACVGIAGGVDKLDGNQGVLVPRSNVADLMLRPDVVDAVRAGLFQVHAMKDVDEGIEILSGRVAGRKDARGRYTEGSLHAAVRQRLRELARDVDHGGSDGRPPLQHVRTKPVQVPKGPPVKR